MADQSPTADPPPAAREAQAANLFDLRRIIGGLFTVWGVLLVILGLTDSEAEIAKAADVNINLWAGLGMLALGVLFLVWAFTRPLAAQLAAAEGPGSEQPGGGAGGDGEGAGRGADAGR
jgi:hypothetical protein